MYPKIKKWNRQGMPFGCPLWGHPKDNLAPAGANVAPKSQLFFKV
jgi:hypothetical protein